MDHLIKALDSGKRRGYDEVRPLDSIQYLFQYAIKKEKENYVTYFLKIEESKYDVFEDYADETILTFSTLKDALQYLEGKGADINKLSPIKGTLPF
ncbi:hypothetical protein ACIQAL_29195 [Pseudomonas sp. NPDC088368]|jgi:hypothetical protein|uniref:hypothetical protein n=1 Tax=unclassified Pseudomonas TaxID=196821 RepID=UPI001412FEB7|nr:hypothetical protein [Pseudomonas sp. SLFW]NBB10726.1 hypothetical protein [Pseudomonas sp. SLFW]